MKRERLMAADSLRWCQTHIPLRLRATILPKEERWRRNISVSL